eukprot:SAG25_NODE_4932_length_729_cov_0.823810_1_plen_21_part_10
MIVGGDTCALSHQFQVALETH